jgi:hypothetical protein
MSILDKIRLAAGQIFSRGRDREAPADGMHLLFEDDEIEISHERGNSGTAIVSFSGIGMKMGGAQIEEFRKSLAGTSHDIYYVKDKSRHWYNSSFDRISDLLNRDMARRKIRHVLTLGNSMGGFGAIAFAGRLRGCHSAIAFAAQSSVDPSIVPWDRRYRKFTDSVTEWAGLDAAKLLVPSVNYTLFFGDVSPIDTRHARRMAQTGRRNMSIYVMVGAGHGVAGFLKRQGVLHELVQTLISQKGGRFDASAILKGLEHQQLGKGRPGPAAGARPAPPQRRPPKQRPRAPAAAP